MAAESTQNAALLAPAEGSETTAVGVLKLREQFASLRSGSGFLARERGRLRLTGNDRVRWLNGMVTNNIRDLAPSHGVYAFLLNPQGHILGDLYAFHRGDHLLVETDPAQVEKIQSTFDHYIIMDDVEVENVSTSHIVIAVAGPRTIEVLKAAGLPLPELAPLQVTDLPWQGANLTVVRSDTAPQAYEIWITQEAAERATAALVAAGGTSVSPQVLELYRIALGIPRYGQDIRERDLPQETEQQRALNFSKGCYVGQEIVERIRSRGSVHRKFAGFHVQGPPPAPGTRIESQGKEVGEITSVASLPLADSDRVVALGYIRREALALKKELQAGAATLTAAEVPFSDLLQA